MTMQENETKMNINIKSILYKNYNSFVNYDWASSSPTVSTSVNHTRHYSTSFGISKILDVIQISG